MSTTVFCKNYQLDDGMIKEDGSLFLQEKEIKKEKQVKLWVESKEQTHHNRPHIHASFDDRVYSIAIDSSFDLLAPNKEDKYYRFIVKTIFNDTTIQKCREYWNKYTDSNMKFAVCNGSYSSKYSAM